MENCGIIKSHAQLKYRQAGMRNNESIHRGLSLRQWYNNTNKTRSLGPTTLSMINAIDTSTLLYNLY